MENLTKLYGKDGKGQIRVWSIWSEDDTIVIEHGALNGELQTTTENVEYGLATRTLEEQIISRINSRVNKKIDRGYVKNLEDAKKSQKRNGLGYKMPMKCQGYDKRKDKIKDTHAHFQNKLDGHHCNITNDGGKIVAYSNNGKIIDSIEEILNTIRIPEGRTVESELYHHGTALQTISSWVRKRQEDTLKLSCVIYDIDLAVDYDERYNFLNNEIGLGHNCKIIDSEIKPFADIKTNLREALVGGYEGLIARLPGFPHQDGKRSMGTIKIKTSHFEEFVIDDEFLVVDIVESKDGWAILICQNEAGGIFKVSAPGDMNEKYYTMRNKREFIGKHVNVQYPNLTKSGLPAQPIATGWREKAEE